ncbi:hypothetical protein L596_020942 [Steinernema carpocapsae]|uniref:Secreted protein n=1 Tax=Steinernema carpocapsae TaxID=34508 RepID=A0A4U5MUZ3_STECR|nr:hypothetical protein L596_020942 [Steinernema carpocapsae]
MKSSSILACLHLKNLIFLILSYGPTAPESPVLEMPVPEMSDPPPRSKVSRAGQQNNPLPAAHWKSAKPLPDAHGT